MSRIVFLNRYYWPEETATAQLLTDLAEALAAAGRSVVVLARDPGRTAARQNNEEVRRGVHILRLATTAAAGTGIVAKLRQFVSFHRAVRRTLATVVTPGDCVVALTDPPLIGVAAAGVGAPRGARLFHWIQDIYPEVAASLAPGPWWNALKPGRDRAWQRAEACVTLGEDMARLVAARGVARDRLWVQPNWAPAGLLPAQPNRGRGTPASPLVVGYSGNMGRVHDLDAVLTLAEAVRQDRDIVFQFTGGGPQRARIERVAAEKGLSQVRFAPPVPRESLSAALAAADIHLVALRPGCEACVFPSKLYGAAAVGRPLIFLGPRQSGIAQLIEAKGIGRAFAAPDAIGAAAATLRALRDDPALLATLSAAAAGFGAEHAGPAAAAELWLRLTDPARLDRAGAGPQIASPR